VASMSEGASVADKGAGPVSLRDLSSDKIRGLLFLE
jgi:hypothetical protein